MIMRGALLVPWIIMEWQCPQTALEAVSEVISEVYDLELLYEPSFNVQCTMFQCT